MSYLGMRLNRRNGLRSKLNLIQLLIKQATAVYSTSNRNSEQVVDCLLGYSIDDYCEFQLELCDEDPARPWRAYWESKLEFNRWVKRQLAEEKIRLKSEIRFQRRSQEEAEEEEEEATPPPRTVVQDMVVRGVYQVFGLVKFFSVLAKTCI